MNAGVGRGRWVITAAQLVTALLLAGGSSARAQSTSTTVLVSAEDGIPQADVTRVIAAVRQGVDNRNGVRFIHSADAVLHEAGSSRDASTLDRELDRLVMRAHEGAFETVLSESTSLVARLTQSPRAVQRTQLREARLLEALAHCGLGDAGKCDDGFSRVIVGAETVPYDSDRFPPTFASRYEATRRNAVEGGERGSVRVSTEPAGAEIFVDGRSVGPSPAVVEGLLVGEHHIASKLAGFEVVQQLVSVRTDREQSVAITMGVIEPAASVVQKVPLLVGVAGPHAAPAPIAGLRSELGTDQVILASLQRVEERLRLSFYVYDLRTGFLLDNGQREFSDADIPTAVAGLVQRSYADVPLDGVVARAPVERSHADVPVYRRWWFWAGIAAAAAAGGLTVGLAMPRSSEVPSGVTRIDGVVR